MSTTCIRTAGIALATAADGEALTRRCFGDRVAWVPWRRPGFQLGLDIAAIQRDHPEAIGVILGGHGITAWGATSDECEANSLEIIRTAERFIAEHGRPDPFGPRLARLAPAAGRRAAPREPPPCSRCCAASPPPTGPQVGHFTDSDVVLDFLAREAHPRLAALGTSCPDHFLRTKVRPLVLDLPPSAPLERRGGAAARAARSPTARTTRAYYARHADAGQPADARRRPGHRPRARRRHVQLRGDQADRSRRRRVLRQRHQRHARRRGRLHLRAHPRVGEVPDRVLGARGGEARADAAAEAARDAGRVRHRRRRPASARPSRTGSPPKGACVVVADIDAVNAEAVAARARWTRRRRQRRRRRHRRGQVVAAAFRDRRPRLRRRRPRRQQRRPVDLQAARSRRPSTTGTSSTT